MTVCLAGYMDFARIVVNYLELYFEWISKGHIWLLILSYNHRLLSLIRKLCQKKSLIRKYHARDMLQHPCRESSFKCISDSEWLVLQRLLDK